MSIFNPARCPPHAALLGACLAGSALAAANGADVWLPAGALHGSRGEGVVAFKGIPYAAPPVGNLRWRPPQPAAAWNGVRDAGAFRHDCAQEPFPYDSAPSQSDFNEDCLYLNVWKPATAGKRTPVMVWIYGGGFVNGGSSPLVYDGSQFAKSGVVLVSFNYRVGTFGFFAHPALSAEQPNEVLGNYGLMDQIAALNWVRRNIAAFGGDPDNVTVFGESAGGMSIHYLMSSPLGAGLFDKAIIESGAGRAGPIGTRRLSSADDSAESVGVKLAQRFGIEGQDAAALGKLRAIPTASLAKGLHMGTMGGDATYVGGPVLDGKLIVGDPATLYQQGVGPRIPVIIGATDRDLGFAGGSTTQELFAAFGKNASAARMLFDPTGTAAVSQVAALIGGDMFMIEPARYMTRILASRDQAVYEYRFSYVAESLRGTAPGAAHASELPYVFDTVPAALGARATAADLQAATVIHDYWVAFAKSGRPYVPGRPAWPSYTTATDDILNFTTSGPIAGPDSWHARLDLATQQHDQRPNE
jgi:para-nitrobenzyl esterase